MKNFVKKLFVVLVALVAVLTISACDKKEDHVHEPEKIEAKAASCTEEGRREAKCSDCGEIISETIKKKAHDYDEYYSDNNTSCTFIEQITLEESCLEHELFG